MRKRPATAAEKLHMARVAMLPCSVCDQPGPSEVHHPRFAAGMGQRADHFLTIALCPPCHRGPQGFHGDRSLWALRKIDEPKALAITYRRLAA